ncbi:MAG: carboxymuconolactone decarboxylase family protein [Terriglobia bacterium]
MARKQPIDPVSDAPGVRPILGGVQDRLAMTPGMMKFMARSPSVLGGYLGFSAALASGVLDAKFREGIALAVSRANQCEVSVALRSEIARKTGMTEGEIVSSQRCQSDDARRAAALKFVSELVVWRGQVTQEAVFRVRNAGYGDAEIVEIAAHVAMVTLANCFECIARSETQIVAAPDPQESPAGESPA